MKSCSVELCKTRSFVFTVLQVVQKYVINIDWPDRDRMVLHEVIFVTVGNKQTWSTEESLQGWVTACTHASDILSSQLAYVPRLTTAIYHLSENVIVYCLRNMGTSLILEGNEVLMTTMLKTFSSISYGI